MLSRRLARRWLLALVPTGAMLSIRGARAAAPPSPAELLLNALGAPDSLATIGRAATVAGRDAGLRHATAEELAAAIIERHAALGAKLHDRRALRRALAGAVRADFAREDVVVVEGWVLARVEAELALLAVRHARVA